MAVKVFPLPVAPIKFIRYLIGSLREKLRPLAPEEQRVFQQSPENGGHRFRRLFGKEEIGQFRRVEFVLASAQGLPQ